MKVQIEKDLYIESDSMGFIVVQYGTRENKKMKTMDETKDILGHFTTVRSAANWIVTNHKIHQSTATTLAELIQEFQQLREWIEEKIKF